MQEPYFTCKNCKEDYRDHEEYQSYPEQHEDVDKPKCINCGERTLEWHVPEHTHIHQMWSDYAHQCFRNADGTVADTSDIDADFSCPKCFGPAKLTSITAHYEHHECLNCEHEFNVS